MFNYCNITKKLEFNLKEIKLFQLELMFKKFDNTKASILALTIKLIS